MTQKNTFRFLGGLIVFVLMTAMIVGCSGHNPIVTPSDYTPPSKEIPEPEENPIDPFAGGDKAKVATKLGHLMASFGGSIAGSLVGFGVDWALSSILGTEDEYSIDDIQNHLNDMDDKLNEIQSAIENVDKKVDSIADMLEFLEIQGLTSDMYIEAFDVSMSICETIVPSYGSQFMSEGSDFYNKLDELNELINLDPNNLTDDQIQRMDDLEIYIAEQRVRYAEDHTQDNYRGIKDCLTLIHSRLVGGSHGINSDWGLLNLWPEYLLKCDKSKDQSLSESHRKLENSFCELLNAEIQGFLLLTDCMNDLKTARSENYKYPDGTSPTGDDNIELYFTDWFKPRIQKQLKLYLNAVEYLVIGYMEDYLAANISSEEIIAEYLPVRMIFAEADFTVINTWYSLLCGRDPDLVGAACCNEIKPFYGQIVRVIGDEFKLLCMQVDHPKGSPNYDTGHFLTINDAYSSASKRYPYNTNPEGNADGYIGWDGALENARKCNHIQVLRYYSPVADDFNLFFYRYSNFAGMGFFRGPKNTFVAKLPKPSDNRNHTGGGPWNYDKSTGTTKLVSAISPENEVSFRSKLFHAWNSPNDSFLFPFNWDISDENGYNRSFYIDDQAYTNPSLETWPGDEGPPDGITIAYPGIRMNERWYLKSAYRSFKWIGPSNTLGFHYRIKYNLHHKLCEAKNDFSRYRGSIKTWCKSYVNGEESHNPITRYRCTQGGIYYFQWSSNTNHNVTLCGKCPWQLLFSSNDAATSDLEFKVDVENKGNYNIKIDYHIDLRDQGTYGVARFQDAFFTLFEADHWPE